MTTQTGYVMTLANSIIGVSLLAMPYCFKQCGLLLAIVLLLTSNVVTRLACHFLVKSALMCRRKNFEYVGYHAFGIPGKLLVELGVIGFLMGTNVAYFVVIGDLAPAIILKLLNYDNIASLRSTVLFVAGMCIILPLSMLRNIESLAAISTGTMLFYLMLVLKVLGESFPHLASADWLTTVNVWRPEGILQCFPIFAMALSCQTQVLEILAVLPNPSLEKMDAVIKAAVALCTSLYIGVGVLGYIAYALQPFAGNVLLSFSSSVVSDLFQLGFVVSIALSFPIVVFPCRASLNSLLYNKGAQYYELTTATTYIPDARFKLLTLGIVGTGLVTGLFIPNIELVLGFVGSTIGVAICIIFPSAAFISISGKNTTERLLAKCVLILGVLVMILGIYGNLSVSADIELHHQPGDVSPLVHSPMQRTQPSPPLIVPGIESKLQKIDEKVNAAPPVAKADVDEKRQEPPVPVESADAPVVRKKSRPIGEVLVSPKPESPVIPVEQAKQSDSVPIAAVDPPKVDKPIETVHIDAIAKEEHQINEEDKIEKKEEVRQGEELLKKLQEHKEEQKQLLKEQQNILDEIKIRDGNPAPEKVVKAIEPEKFDENINKIQEVIDDLKERKQTLDKTKGEKIAEDKLKNAKKKLKIEETVGPKKDVPVLLMAIAPSISNVSVDKQKINVTKKEAVGAGVGRDILSVTTVVPERMKREAHEEESCAKVHPDSPIPLKHVSGSEDVLDDTKELNPPGDSLKAFALPLKKNKSNHKEETR